MLPPTSKASRSVILIAQLALAALQVVEQIFEALDQVFAAAFDGGPQHLRVGRNEIGRRNASTNWRV